MDREFRPSVVRDRLRGPRRGLLSAVVAGMIGTSLVALAQPAQALAVPLTTGANDVGQQGNGSTAARLTPGPISGPAAVAIASGREHAYLLDAQSRIWAWGNNAYGEIGDGSSSVRRTPVQLGLTSVAQVEAGHYHGIALRTDGTVWTWGMGTRGQLGLGSTANRNVPTQVSGLTGISAVAAGRDMSYALRNDGRVLAWGSNALGEVGDGTTTRRLTPVLVPGVTGVVELGAGRNHVLARTSDGAVWAWGDNQYGQVGDGTTALRTSPVRIITSGIAAVDAGAHHSVAARTDGTVLTWGRGYRGQLGLGTVNNRLSPVTVPGVSDVVEVGDGRDQTFAVTSQGRVYAWGNNTAGQLGDGTTTQRNSPVLLAVTGIAAVQSGSSHSVFLPGDGTPPPNQPPAASFTSSCTDLTCTFTSTSTDPDGTITGTEWAFGDGSTGSGAVVQHEFAQAGTYRVTVTVTDDDSATGTTFADVEAGAVTPPATPVAFVASSSANASATVHRVTLPATVQAGDCLVLLMTTNTVAAIPEPAGVTGWAGVQNVAGGDFRTRAWERIAVAGDGGRQLSVTLPATIKASLAVLAYRNCSAGGVTASAAAVETVSRTAHTAPAVAVAAEGSRLISAWADKSSATTTMTAPAGTTARLLSTGSSSGRITALVADSQPAAGTAAPLTATANSATAKATMLSLVIAPA